MDKKSTQLNPSRMKQGEYERTVWVATVEQGVGREDLKDPSFWAHVANKLRPWDKLEVRADDGTFYSEYLILACDRAWAQVHELMYASLTTSDISLTQADTLQLKFRGPHLKWSVIRTADGAVLKEQCQTKDEASAWMDGHIKTVGV